MFSSRRAAGLVSLVILTSLTACANNPNSKNLEQTLAADPRLSNNPVGLGLPNDPNRQNDAIATRPADFPPEIPLYPNAQLQEVEQPTSQGTDAGSASARFVSSDPSNLIESFYQKEFQTNNWELSPPLDDRGGTFKARRNDLQVTVSIQPRSATGTAAEATPSPNQPNAEVATQFVIEYTRNPSETAQATTNAEAAVPKPGDPDFTGPVQSSDVNPQPAQTSVAQTPTAASGTQVFTDINKAPQELRQYIEDLAALGILSPSTGSKSNHTNTTQFQPSKTISRREYARWLVAANNAIYANRPAQQIRGGSEASQPAFQDVSRTDPDFPLVQGLAEAGIISSPLSGDSTAVLFRPDAPLTREQLILWKIPLDTHQALPNASLDAVKQTWGFQDVGKIDPKALRAVLADFQNSDQSNIRRVFGYTTLFQPKKPVTRAEAAAALWYFGTQSEGISAKDALQLQRQPSPAPASPTPTPSTATQ